MTQTGSNINAAAAPAAAGEPDAAPSKPAGEQLKIRRQNRWLLNIAWWMALVLLGEAYVFSPVPALLSEGFVDNSHWLFWPMFWCLYVAFLLVQSAVHIQVLHRYYPEWRRSNLRFAIGVPLAAVAGLVGLMILVLPVTHTI